MKKRISAMLLALCLVLALLPGTAAAVESGTCGDNLTWTPDGRTLTISGSGMMEDYAMGTAPWYNTNLHSDTVIKELIIEKGITSIGENAFYGCSWIENIDIPDSVTSIG